MNPTTRIILLATLSLIFLATTGSGYLYLTQRNQLSQENQQLTTDLDILTEENDSFKGDIKRLTNDLYQVETDHKQLKQDHATLLQDRDVLSVQAETLTHRNQILIDKLNMTEGELAQAVEERDDLIHRLDQIELEREAKLPRIAVRRRTVDEKGSNETQDEEILREQEEAEVLFVPEKEALAAKIIDVNDKHRFFVINSGSRNGIQQSMVFSILDNKQKEIGTAEVVEVREQVSALSILQLSRRKKVKPEFWVIEKR